MPLHTTLMIEVVLQGDCNVPTKNKINCNSGGRVIVKQEYKINHRLHHHHYHLAFLNISHLFLFCATCIQFRATLFLLSIHRLSHLLLLQSSCVGLYSIIFLLNRPSDIPATSPARCHSSCRMDSTASLTSVCVLIILLVIISVIVTPNVDLSISL